jgi:hypothetical protein
VLGGSASSASDCGRSCRLRRIDQNGHGEDSGDDHDGNHEFDVANDNHAEHDRKHKYTELRLNP